MAQHSDAHRFLQAVFPDFSSKAIFANLNPPDHKRDYTALDQDRDCYWSIAAFPPEARTNLGDNELYTVALALDDVGTKGPNALTVEMKLGLPTAIVESSAGNFQWVYRLSRPVAKNDWPGFLGGVDALLGCKLEARGAQTLMRLPMGHNTKPGKGNFAVRLVELNPGIELDPSTIVHAPITGPGPSSSEPRLKQVGGYLSLIPNNDLPYDEWMARMHQVKALALDEVEAFEAFSKWSAQSSKHNQDETERRWNTVHPTHTSGLVLMADAEAADPKAFEALQAAEAGEAFDDDPPPPDPTGWKGGYSITHADMAGAIVAQERGLLGWLSNSKGNRWGGFDPVLGRWVVEDHDRLMRSAVRLEITAARAAGAGTKALAEAKWQGAVQSLLTRHGDLLVPFEKFDADLDTFGIPGGVMRLGPGGAVEEKGAASQMVSKACNVRPAPVGAKGVAWEAFMREFTMGDPELLAWWQAFCGYCLTGHIHEHLVVFLYGPGGNGKSVFLDTLAEVMGPYHERAASAVFMAQQGSKHMAMVADLCGARLVTSPDVPLGASWDLGMLKPLTGGGTFKAQFMKENWFKFTPQFKLILAGNEKPILGTVDAAVRRRFVLVPAMHVPKRINKQLVDVLRGERAAILRWMLDGWERYNIGGLPPCARIERETADYINEQDTFGKWFGSTITVVAGDQTKHRIADLWNGWDAFRASEGAWKAAPINKQALSTKLREAGLDVDRDNQGGYVWGISVVKPTTSSAQEAFPKENS